MYRYVHLSELQIVSPGSCSEVIKHLRTSVLLAMKLNSFPVISAVQQLKIEPKVILQALSVAAVAVIVHLLILSSCFH